MKKTNDNKIILKEAKTNDLLVISELENLIYKNPWPLEAFESSFNTLSTKTIVALINKEIVAFLVSNTVSSELHINNIAVSPNYRRMGIAIKLMNHIIKLNSKISEIILEHSVKNINALNLYTKLGFKKLYIRKNYYLNGDDASIMLCELSNYKGFIYD